MATIRHSGQGSVDTTGGSIRIEQGADRIVIYDGSKELLVIDKTGILFSDSTKRRIKLGSAPDDGRVGLWISKPGQDIMTLLGGS